MAHLLEHLREEVWNTMLFLNSTALALASFYTVFAAGASIYYWTLRPLELGVTFVAVLLCSEIVFAILEETF